MIWRSGRLTQPRLGVSSTMPLLVSSGPGAPTPTPTISAPGSSRSGLLDRPLGQRDQPVEDVALARLRRRSARCPARAAATRPRPRCRRRDWCRRCQFRGQIAPDSSALCHGRHRRGYGFHRQVPHAAVMAQRTDLRAMPGAGPARQPVVTQRDVARPPGAEAELRHRGSEDRHDRRPDRSGEVQRRRVVGDQYAPPAGSAPRRRAGSARPRRSPPGRGPQRRWPRRAAASSAPPTITDRPLERRPRARRSRASAWWPRSSPAPAPRTRARLRATRASARPAA